MAAWVFTASLLLTIPDNRNQRVAHHILMLVNKGDMENAIKAIIGGISYVKYYHRSLIKALLIPFILLVLITMLAFVPHISSKDLTVVHFLQLIPDTLIAITTHKIILEGPNSVPVWGINRFGPREIKFITYAVLMVIIALPAILFTLIPYVGAFISACVFAYIASRLSLVYPGIAIGADMDFKKSWEATNGFQFMMIVVVVLYPLLFTLLDMLLSALPGFWVWFIISTSTTVLLVASLSVSYKIIIESQMTAGKIDQDMASH